MSVIGRPTHCPRCVSRDIQSLGRVEAGDMPGLNEDVGVFACGECGYEWDTGQKEWEHGREGR